MQYANSLAVCARLFHIVVVTALIWSVGCEPNSAEHLLQQTEQAIVNGTRDPQAVDLSAGEQLAIGWLYYTNESDESFCTGTLISASVVVTAAHCVDYVRANQLGFGIGMSPSDPVATFDVSEIITHSSLDVSVLVLEDDATENTPELVPVAANQRALNDDDLGTALQAGGYGETYDSSREGRWFATVYLDEILDYEIIVDGRGIQGICYGDSGGPVIFESNDGAHVIMAVESHGDSSCVDNDWMTRLDVVADWLADIMGEERPPDPCDGLDYLGRCDGDVAEWCEAGTYQSRDCAALGTECGYVNDQVGYICVCGDLDYDGRCNGDLLEYCENGVFRQVDCQRHGMDCGYITSEATFDCTNSPECEPGSETPHCQADRVVWCVDGEMHVDDCVARGETCDDTGDSALCTDGGTSTDDVGIVDAADVGFADLISDGAVINPDSGDGTGEGTGGGGGGGISGCGCSVSVGSSGLGPVWWLLGLVLWLKPKRKR